MHRISQEVSKSMKSVGVLFGGMRGKKLHHVGHVFKTHGFMSFLKKTEI